MQTDESSRSTPRSWGGLGDAGFWFSAVFIFPALMVLGALGGGLLGEALGLVLSLPFLGDPRFEGSALNALADALLTWGWAPAAALGAVASVSWWGVRGPMSVRLEGERLVAWTLTGRRTILASDVTRACVVAPPDAGGDTQHLAVHLSTPWRELVIPARRVLRDVPMHARREIFDDLTTELSTWLADAGRHMELGVPTSTVTAAHHPILWWATWPHRRWLAARAAALDRPDAPGVDHHRSRLGFHLAWALRPAFGVALVIGLALVAAVRWGTTDALAPWLLTILGALAGFALLGWNILRDRARGLVAFGRLTPEAVIGRSAIPEEARLLRPAPGCEVDLNERHLQRPDGVRVSFDDITEVEYGPISGRGAAVDLFQRALASTRWHLAVRVRGASHPVQIYTNASVDIVRYGDLDAGYAAFNWALARAVAASSGANLTLAKGRVAASHVGRPLVQRLQDDINQYESDHLIRHLRERGERCRVHIRQSAERFEVWGPLTRQPEACATPPLYKAALLLGALALMPLGWTPAGLIAGYLAARVVSEVVSARLFAAPGFVLDRRGVWVRGQHIPWAELEESTLLPVAPGPILFCGPRAVLVAGHLGGSYHERAWLGCEAYRWIRRYAPLDEDPP